MPDVFHIASMHGPRDNRIWRKECHTLAAAGYEVVYVVPAAPPAAGDNADGASGLEAVRASGGGDKLIRVHALPNRSGAGRLLRTPVDVLVAARSMERSALLHFHDAFLLPSALLLRMTGRRIVYDAHEDTPRQVMHFGWIPAPFRRPVSLFMSLMEWLAAKSFQGFVAATPEIALRFPADRTIVVPNYPLLSVTEAGAGGHTSDDLLDRQTAAVSGKTARAGGRPRRSRAPRLVYAGGISMERGLLTMLSALAILNDAASGGGEIRLDLIGRFIPASLEQTARRHRGWRHVDFRGWVNPDQLQSHLAGATIGLSLLHPTPQYLHAVPTKLYEYMEKGLPIVASDFPAYREVVHREACGILVDPMSPQAVADAVTQLVEDPDAADAMGQRGAEAIRTRYNWNDVAERLVAFYRQQAGPPDPARRSLSDGPENLRPGP